MPGVPNDLSEPRHDTEQPDVAETPVTVGLNELRHTRLDLRGNLERLPKNHPSSPYQADGTRKPPVPDLADRELSILGDPVDRKPNELEIQEPRLELKPLTDSQWEERLGQVRDRLGTAHSKGIATDRTCTVDPLHQVWSSERDAIHDEILSDLVSSADNIPTEKKAVLAGGLPGSGKTTVLEQYARANGTAYYIVDPDRIKAELARRGLVPELQGVSPMEATDLAHEESSHIAKRLAHRLQAAGKNIIWDITMSSVTSTERRINDLKSAGYQTIEGIFVDIPIEVSIRRAEARHRSGHEKYRAGDGEGGRLVPEELIRKLADPEWGSVNRRIFEKVKHQFSRWSVFDNSEDGQPPVLINTSLFKEQK